MSTEKLKQEFLSKSGLIARGWTEGKINELLGEPDKLAINSYYRSGPKVRLYEKGRVKNIEESDLFKEWIVKAEVLRQKRSVIALKTAERKRKELIDYINSLKIFIAKMEPDALYKKAVKHYNWLWAERGEDKYASLTDDKSFLNRIAVNMLRHAYTDYEEHLDEMFGQIGVNLGYKLLKTKILNQISEIYSFLKNECDKQIAELS